MFVIEDYLDIPRATKFEGNLSTAFFGHVNLRSPGDLSYIVHTHVQNLRGGIKSEVVATRPLARTIINVEINRGKAE